jgi:phosphopantetheine adenylyltransferase
MEDFETDTMAMNIEREKDQDKEDKMNQVSKKMQELMETPLTLQSWCRISIMRTMGFRYIKKMKKLEQLVPDNIAKFLQGEDLICDE